MNIFSRIMARIRHELFATPEDELRYSIVDAELDGDFAAAEVYAADLAELRAKAR